MRPNLAAQRWKLGPVGAQLRLPPAPMSPAGARDAAAMGPSRRQPRLLIIERSAARVDARARRQAALRAARPAPVVRSAPSYAGLGGVAVAAAAPLALLAAVVAGRGLATMALPAAVAAALSSRPASSARLTVRPAHALTAAPANAGDAGWGGALGLHPACQVPRPATTLPATARPSQSGRVAAALAARAVTSAPLAGWALTPAPAGLAAELLWLVESGTADALAGPLSPKAHGLPRRWAESAELRPSPAKPATRATTAASLSSRPGGRAAPGLGVTTRAERSTALTWLHHVLPGTFVPASRRRGLAGWISPRALRGGYRSPRRAKARAAGLGRLRQTATRRSASQTYGSRRPQAWAMARLGWVARSPASDAQAKPPLQRRPHQAR